MNSRRIPRTLYGPAHEAFRGSVQRFYAAELVPHMPRWEDEGMVPKVI